MKPRTLLLIAAIGLTPATLRAQSAPLAPEAPQLPPTVVPPVPLSPAPPPAPMVPSVPRIAGVAEAPPVPPAPEAPQKAPAPPRPAAAPVPPAPPQPQFQMINVRIEVTLSDSKGAPKVLTMTVADGENGMNRTTTESQADYSFNADARPYVMGDRIRLRLTADATVPVEGDKRSDGSAPRLGLRQSQTIVLRDGETMEIARAADPTSDRAFILSVKATIQR